MKMLAGPHSPIAQPMADVPLLKVAGLGAMPARIKLRGETGI